jgi:8-oxo-dGTP diphosphatase
MAMPHASETASQAQARPRPTLAVGGVVVHDDALLLVKRGNEPNKGLWTVPGGRVESGEFMTDTCRREVMEETGIEIEVDELAGFFEVLGDPHLVIFDFFARPVGTNEPVAGDDAADVRWVPLAEVKDLDLTPRFMELMTQWGVFPAEGASS